jgi:hypothetical protein
LKLPGDFLDERVNSLAIDHWVARSTDFSHKFRLQQSFTRHARAHYRAHDRHASRSESAATGCR